MATTKHAKCTFEMTTAVWVVVRGEKVSDDRYQVREDDGLVGRLLKWTSDNDSLPIFGTPGTSGPGIYARCHYPADAKRLADWLRSEGVKPTR